MNKVWLTVNSVPCLLETSFVLYHLFVLFQILFSAVLTKVLLKSALNLAPKHTPKC